MPSIAAAADVLQATLEKVNPLLPELLATYDTVANLVKTGGAAEKITNKLFRIPQLQYRGGNFGKFDADGGDMGSGTGMKVVKLTGGYFDSRYTVEITKKAIDVTDSPEQAIVNAFSYQLKNALREVSATDNVAIHTSGNGVLTSSVGASATSTWATGTKTTYTFADATDTIGVDRLRPGMVVGVYGTGGTPKRTDLAGTTNSWVIDHIDWVNKVVYLDGLVNAAASTDLLAFDGLAATLTTGADWPTTLTADTFRHGLPYFVNSSTSGYTLGQLRANNTELLSNYVNASSAALTFQHVQAVIDQAMKRRDPETVRGSIGLFHQAQRAQIFNTGIAIAAKLVTGNQFGQSVDLMPSNNASMDKFEVCGIPCMVDPLQDKSRVDFIIPKLWGRAMLHDTKFYEAPQGGKGYIFESRATTGNVKAAWHFHIVQAFDYYCVDPGAQSYVGSLSVPALYA